jgi:hypothetical protein
MASKLFFVTVESITLDTVGEPVNVDDKSIKHAVTASLLYPRSGAPNITSALTIQDLSKGPNILPSDSFYDNGIFKEEVQDSTMMSLKVISRQSKSNVEKFLLAFFATVLGAGLGVVTGGLGNILGAITGFGIDKLKSGIQSAGDDEVIVIGETGNIPIDILRIGASPVSRSYILTVREEIVKLFIDPVTGNKGKLKIAPGGNGSIKLRMWAEEY